MKIKEIILSNFKGVNETTSVEIKPITIFIGANSSGKSTIIHSIATLAQTLKIQNNSKPLILDDEQAYVHLGRFIDVIHTKSYKDAIILGFVINNVQLPHFSKNDKGKENIELIETNVKVEFKFKCIMRTQEIVLTHGEYTIGNDKYIVERGKDDYKLTNMTTKKQIDIIASSGFIFEIEKQMINNKFLSGYFGDFINFFSMQNAIKASFNSVMYLGPFRQPPQRPYQSRGSNPIEVGSMGESAVTLLANEIIQLRTRNHISQIAKWLEILGMAENIDVNRILKSDLFDINITLKDKTKFSLADLGYGFSQVLPVLVQCSFAKKDSMLLFEQPEIHLHALSARNLAKIFIDTHKQTNSDIILETHSIELVNQFQNEIRSGNISVQDIAVYKAERIDKSTCLKRLPIDEDLGEICTNWSKGINS